jgi:hypothetical protein
MKTAEAKKPATTARQNKPFFQRKSEQSFFGKRPADNPFFTTPSPIIQTKLTIGQPGDKYEEEADAMADQVVQRLSDAEAVQTKPDNAASPVTPLVQAKCAACEEEEKLQKKEEDKEELKEEVQKKPIFGYSAPPPEEEIQRKCDACEKEEKLQKKSASVSSQTTSPVVERNLNASKGTGVPLPATTRKQMESAFGTDFSNVNIHTGSQAVAMNKSLHAQAFTHGADIYFNEGKYNPDTSAGSHLLAHELTHTVQQGASQKRGNVQTKSEESVPEIQCLAPLLSIPLGIAGRYVAGRIVRWGIGKLLEEPQETLDMALIMKKSLLSLPVNIKGMAYFKPPSLIAEHIKAYAILANMFKKYPNLFGVTDEVIRDYERGPHVHLQYGNSTQTFGRIRWDISSGTYQMEPYQMVINHPMFNFTKTPDVLGMEVSIQNSKITGNVGVAHSYEFYPHIFKVNITDHPTPFPFSFSLLEKAVLGNEAEKAFPVVAYGILTNGFIDLMYSGLVDIKNFHFIKAFLHIQDKEAKEEWKGELDLDVMGMQPFTLEIDRSPQGLLSGINKQEKILLDKTFAKKGTDTDEEKGFEFTSNIKATYLNGILTIQGEASYNSRRAQGNLFLMVTDYSTAKEHALQFLPQEIAAKAEADEPPPNPSERLAFMGAGNLSFTLFDGNKETREIKIGNKKHLFGEEPEEQLNKALQADASFVVEPEGYISIAGQVKPQQEEFNLFDQKKYEKEIELLEIPIARIPGPLATSADFNFEVNLKFGASIGPLTLSEIKAEGLYSNRPDTLSELELSGLIKLPGELFVNLSFCVEVEGSILGVFSIELIEACIEAGVGMVGAVQARPTIHLIPPTAATINTPPEYYIRGNFHLDAGGKIFLQLGDSLKINLTEKDPDQPNDWRYKNSREIAKKEFGSRDVEIPTDHTLGSQEIPRVSFKEFIKENLKNKLTNLITSDRPRKKENADKYFEPGKATGAGGSKPDRSDTKFGTGGFEEGREEKGKLVDDTIPKTTDKKEANYVFEESFNMSGAPHALYLIVKQTELGDQLQVDTVLLMKSELEELTEKIEEEKVEINASDVASKDFQKTDLARIEAQAKQVKDDVKKLGVNNELSNKADVPALKQTALSIQNYGSRYNISDLGEEDKAIEPACDKPKDVHPGDEIFFPHYTGGENIGKVIEIVAYPSADKSTAFWHIRYKPKSGRKRSTHAPEAFDKNCNPTYIIPKEDKGCETIHIEPKEKIVPERVVNKIHYPKRGKADSVKAYPLCWGEELKPKGEIVGMDRISQLKQSKWHRAHLVHAKMGGKGAYWNLVPVPQQVNNSKMPVQYESKLINLVLDGFKNGTQYWFKAEVVYHKDSDNQVIGHYDDFVEEIKIYYGEAVDLGNGQWEFKDDGKLKTTISIGNLPFSNDLAPDRIKG